MAPWITAIIVPHVVRALRAAGVDGDALARGLGLPVDGDYEQRVRFDAVLSLWEAAVEASGRRDLPLLAATGAAHDERSLLTFVAANQPVFGDCVERLDRFFPTVTDAYRWRVDPAEMVCRCEPPVPSPRLGWWCHVEFEAIDLVRTVGRLTAGRARPERLAFVHAGVPEAFAQAIARDTGAAVAFGAGATTIEYPAAAAAVPVPSARPALAALVEQRLARMLDEQALGDDLPARARIHAAALVRDGKASVDALARALHTSRRSLERGLAAGGMRAAALFDDERHRLALAWLPHLTVDEIAARLGYSDGRAFARAFRRWTGASPRALRGAGR